MRNFETLAKAISTIGGVLIAGNAVIHIELNSRLAKLRPNTTNLLATINKMIYSLLAFAAVLLSSVIVLNIIYNGFNSKQISVFFILLAVAVLAFVCAAFFANNDSTEAEIFLEHERILFHVIKVTKEQVFLEEIFPPAHPQFSKYLNGEEAILTQESIDFLDGKSLATYNAKKLYGEAKKSSYYEIVSKKFVGL